jgi:hypothetical protein
MELEIASGGGRDATIAVISSDTGRKYDDRRRSISSVMPLDSTIPSIRRLLSECVMRAAEPRVRVRRIEDRGAAVLFSAILDAVPGSVGSTNILSCWLISRQVTEEAGCKSLR